LKKRLAEREITLTLSEKALELIAREGFDPVYGARPLKRFLQRELETKLGRALIAGDIMDGSVVTLDVKAGGLDFTIHQNGPDKAQAAR
jgi:ATP-dependent Clp protease ATP-binding subunit ClpB